MNQISHFDMQSLYDKYEKKHKDFHLGSLGNLNEGAVRFERGCYVENLIDDLWLDIGLLKQKEHTTNNKKHLVKSVSKKYTINKALDRNCYSNNILKAMIECKAYVDSCYLERADNDSKVLEEGGYVVPKVVVGLENACSFEALNFWLERKNLENVFFLVEGKRSSSKPIYKKEYYKNLSFEKFSKLCNWLYKL